MEWWHWVVAGLILISVDMLLVNVFSIFWFGAGALLTGALLWWFPTMAFWAQVLAFTALSAGFLTLWLIIFRPQRLQRLRREAQQLMPSMQAVVVRFDGGRGSLRLQKPVGGRDVWDFVSSQPRRAGESVIVAKVDDDDVAHIREGDNDDQKPPSEQTAATDN